MKTQTPKDIIIQALPGLYTQTALLLIIYLIRPRLTTLLILVTTYQLIYHLYKAYKTKWDSPEWDKKLITNIILTTIIIMIISILNQLLGKYGFIGFLTISIIIAGILIARQWNTYTWAINEAYRNIYGKTPKKIFWKAKK
jgi:hypothetical protein